MLVVAVSEMNLSPSEFWELSWYEWGLYLLRLKRKGEEQVREYELGWEKTRILWATIVNSYAKHPVKPKELIKLSYDNEPTAVTAKLSSEEVLSRFNKKK